MDLCPTRCPALDLPGIQLSHRPVLLLDSWGLETPPGHWVPELLHWTSCATVWTLEKWCFGEVERTGARRDAQHLTQTLEKHPQLKAVLSWKCNSGKKHLPTVPEACSLPPALQNQKQQRQQQTKQNESRPVSPTLPKKHWERRVHLILSLATDGPLSFQASEPG